MADFRKVASVDELPPGEAKVAEVDGQEVAIYNVEGKIYATSNVCPHQGGALGEGMVEGTTVICPWHAWVFDVTDGTSPMNPRLRIPCYEVRVEGNDILVRSESCPTSSPSPASE